MRVKLWTCVLLCVLLSLSPVFADDVNWGTFDYGTYGLPSNYSGPILVSMTPSIAPRERGITLNATGHNFTDTGQILVSFGETNNSLLRSSCLFESDTNVVCASPDVRSLPIGRTIISLTFDNGLSWTNSLPFGVVEINSLTPAYGPVAAPLRTTVHVGGTGFLNSATYACLFLSEKIIARWVSIDEVTCDAPHAPEGVVGPVNFELELDGRVMTSFKREFVYYRVDYADPVPQGTGSDARVYVAHLLDIGNSRLKCRWAGHAEEEDAQVLNATLADSVTTMVCRLPNWVPELNNDRISLEISTDIGVTWSNPVYVPTYSVTTNTDLVAVGGSGKLAGLRIPAGLKVFACGVEMATVAASDGKTATYTLPSACIPGTYSALAGMHNDSGIPFTLDVFDPAALARDFDVTVCFGTEELINLVEGDNLPPDLRFELTRLPAKGRIEGVGSVPARVTTPIQYIAPSSSAECSQTTSLTYRAFLTNSPAGEGVITLKLSQSPPKLLVNNFIFNYDDVQSEPNLNLDVRLDGVHSNLRYSASSFSGTGSLSFPDNGAEVVYKAVKGRCGTVAQFTLFAINPCGVKSNVTASITIDAGFKMTSTSRMVMPRVASDVTAYGLGFVAPISVDVGSGKFEKSGATVHNCTAFTFRTPESPQFGKYVLSLELGSTKKVTTHYLYSPELISISPNSAFLNGGDVTIGGNYFPPAQGAKVKFGSKWASCTSGQTAGTLACTAPKMSNPGRVSVSVYFDNGKSEVSNSLMFQYQSSADSRKLTWEASKASPTTLTVDACDVARKESLIVISKPLVGNLYTSDGTLIQEVPFNLSACEVVYRPPPAKTITVYEVKTTFKFELSAEEWIGTVLVRNSPPVVPQNSLSVAWGASKCVEINATDPDGDKVHISEIKYNSEPKLGVPSFEIPNLVCYKHLGVATSACGADSDVVFAKFNDGFNSSEWGRVSVDVSPPGQSSGEVRMYPRTVTPGTIEAVIQGGPLIASHSYECVMGKKHIPLTIQTCFLGTCELALPTAGDFEIKLMDKTEKRSLGSSLISVMGVAPTLTPDTASAAGAVRVSASLPTEFTPLSVLFGDHLLSLNENGVFSVPADTDSGTYPVVLTSMDATVSEGVYARSVYSQSNFNLSDPTAVEVAPRAIRLRGNAYISVPLNTEDFDSDSFTLEMAFVEDAVFSDSVALFSTDSFRLVINSPLSNDGAIVLMVLEEGQWKTVKSEPALIEKDISYTVSLVHYADKNETIAYIDGVAVLKASSHLKLSDTLLVGGVVVKSSPRYLFVGRVQELRVFATARSAWDIALGRVASLAGTEQGLVWYAPEDITDPMVGASPAACMPDCEAAQAIVPLTGHLVVLEDTRLDFRAYPIATQGVVEVTKLPRGTLYDFEGKKVIQKAPHGITDPLSRLSYLPPQDEFGIGIDSFTVHNIVFTVDVLPQNDPPVAIEGSGVVKLPSSAALVLNGTDVDGDALTFMVVSKPSVGTLFSMDAAGNTVDNEILAVPFTLPSRTVLYQPGSLAAYEASDDGFEQRFTFVVSDGVETSPAVPVVVRIVRPTVFAEPSNLGRWLGLGGFLILIAVLAVLTVYMRKRRPRSQNDEDSPKEANPPIPVTRARGLTSP